MAAKVHGRLPWLTGLKLAVLVAGTEEKTKRRLGLRGRRSVRATCLLLPDVGDGQIDMLPAEGREMLQQALVDCLTMLFGVVCRTGRKYALRRNYSFLPPRNETFLEPESLTRVQW